MADALVLLENDHRLVEQLFLEFERDQDFGVSQQICEQLKLHTTLEEEILYSVVGKEVDPKLEEEARREHAEARKIIATIEGMTPEDPELERRMNELKAAVQHHVHEEETDIFPKLREEIGPELEALGEALTKRKQDLGGIDAGWATDMPPMGA